MKKIALLFLLLLVASSACDARKYPFDIEHPYEVKMVRVAEQGYKFIKVFGVAKSVDKAMDRAMQDAVAACIFTGVPGQSGVGSISSLCGGFSAYEKNKEYFDKFFTTGAFLNYVRNANSNYPSGENNIKFNGKRKVGIYVVVNYDALRKKLEDDKIIVRISDYF